MKQLTACVLAVILLPCIARAQHPDPDSFRTKLKLAAEDTNKVNLYWKAAASHLYQEPFESLPFFRDGLILAQKLQYLMGVEKCYTGIALSYSFLGKYDSSLYYVDSAVYYARKVGNPPS